MGVKRKGDGMTEWNITIPDETDRSVRQYLQRAGGKAGDLSAFVDRAVQQAIFWETVKEVHAQNRDHSPDDIQALVDEEVSAIRANPS
jgi:hypothetical protein